MEPVVVVGAGPVGLSTALALARQGTPPLLIDAADDLSGEGSRSICIQRDVLDILDRLGVGRAAAAEGVSWTLGRTYFRQRELFQTHLPEARSVFPPFVNLPQWRTQQLLLEQVEKLGEIEVRWQHEVTDLVLRGDEGVTLRCQTPEGLIDVDAGWVVACDGARSAVRRLAGIGFPGHDHSDRFLIADVRVDLPFPTERRFFFDPPFNPGRQVLIHPQPHGIWRFDWQVPADVDAQEERRNGRLDERIRAIVGSAPYDLVWLSSYRFSQRLAERFRSGRVLLAGDAAHLMSPFGARGMNSGISDGENLAWKLALVVDGQAPQALLDSYEAERRAAAKENLAVTDATMRFMVPPSRPRRWLRNAILRASVLPAARRLVDSGRLAVPFDYASVSPIVQPQAGRLAADVPCRLPGDMQPHRLRELVGPEFLAVAWEGQPGHAGELLERARRVAPRVPTRTLVLRDDAEGYLAGSWYVVRPDGYLGAGPVPADQPLGPVVDGCAGLAA